MNEGFIRLCRSYFSHPFWVERRKYDRAAAWLDLVAMCAFEPRRAMINGEMIEIPRGGIAASERFLSDRWMWSRTKVRAFLDVLESENMIKDHQKNHRYSVFLLCNFDKFNPPKEPPEKPQKDHRKTTGEPPGNQIEEGKERKDSLSPPELCPAREIPAWEHVREFSRTIGLAEWKARDAFDRLESTGWRDKGEAIQKWKPYFTRVKTWWEADGRPAGPNGSNGKPAKPKCKYTYVIPVYDDQSRMIRDSQGRNLNPETGEIIP